MSCALGARIEIVDHVFPGEPVSERGYARGCRCAGCTRANTDRVWLTRERKRARTHLAGTIANLGDAIETVNAALDAVIQIEDQRQRRRSGEARHEVRAALVRLDAAQQRAGFVSMRARAGLGD